MERAAFMLGDTAELVAREIRAARRSARRATRAVALFGAWLLITWFGPAVGKSGYWGLWPSAVAVAGYTLLTLLALAAVSWGAFRVVGRGVLRRVVSTHLVPFWVLLLGTLCVGGLVYVSVDRPIEAAWLAVGSVLTLLSAAYAAARHREVRALEIGRRQVARRAPTAGTRTWTRELHDRLDAVRSMRLD